MRNYYYISVLLFALISQAVWGAGGFRLIPLKTSQLNGLTLQQGEFSFDDSMGTLGVHINGARKLLAFKDDVQSLKNEVLLLPKNITEKYPLIKVIGIKTLFVDAGRVLINGKSYKNTSPTSCRIDQIGRGGGENSITVTNTWYSLYLIPALNGSNFDCIVSSSHLGPVVAEFTSAWKRIFTFFVKQDQANGMVIDAIYSRNGKSYYPDLLTSSNMPTPTGYHKWSNIPANTCNRKQYFVSDSYLSPVANGGTILIALNAPVNNLCIYSDSSCLYPIQCATAGGFIAGKINTPFTLDSTRSLYYKFSVDSSPPAPYSLDVAYLGYDQAILDSDDSN